MGQGVCMCSAVNVLLFKKRGDALGKKW